MIAYIKFILAITLTLVPSGPLLQGEDIMTWAEFHAEEYLIAESEFDKLFEAVEYKRSKNNRSMTKGSNSKSFRFI